MFFTVSKIGAFFFAPTHIGLLLVAFGVALLHTRFTKTGRRLATVGVVALLVMGFSPLAATLIAPLENRFPPPPADAPPPDGVVVLGGAMDETITAARNQPVLNDAAERLTMLVELARRYPQARVVFTGGAAALTEASHTEAEAAARLLTEMGVEPGRVIYESRSRNTWENAVYTRALVAPEPSQRWLLVTSAWHMPRAMGIFRQVGFPVTAFPVDYHTANGRIDRSVVRSAADALRLLEMATHEWVGLVAYRLTGKSDALFPAP